jgi:hypothetical protein
MVTLLPDFPAGQQFFTPEDLKDSARLSRHSLAATADPRAQQRSNAKTLAPDQRLDWFRPL